jgi:hypothetical protein
MPYRRVATDRAGMNAGAVEEAAARNVGLPACTGLVTDPPRKGQKPARPRPCAARLDPVLGAAGYTTHPNCDPAETSPTAGPPGDPATLPRYAPSPADQAPAGKCGGCGHKAHRDECPRKWSSGCTPLLDPATGNPTGTACFRGRAPCPCPHGWCHTCKAPVVGAKTLPLDDGQPEIDIDRGSAGDPDGEWAVWKLADGRLACRRLAPGEPLAGDVWRGRAHIHQLTPKEATR